MKGDLPVFRSMQEDDIGTVAEMVKSLYRSLGTPDDYITNEKIEATFKQHNLQTGYLQIEVFEINKMIAGYALLFKYWYNEFGGMVLNVDELFVKPEFRDQGIASLYLSELSRKAKDYVALSLEVLPTNKEAYSLYRRTGFTEKETVALYKMLEL
jgi:ribosomal protein S18 acetylase RimI-like enzyme